MEVWTPVIDAKAKSFIMHPSGCIICVFSLDSIPEIEAEYSLENANQIIKNLLEGIQVFLNSQKTLLQLGRHEFLIATRLHNSILPQNIADIIRETLSSITEVEIEYSIGFKVFQPQSEEIRCEIAITQAREALARSKLGAGKLAIFNPEIDGHETLEHKIHSGVFSAAFSMSPEQFQPVFLPIVEVNQTHRKIIGAEALVRWNHPGYGLLRPAAFLSAARRSKQICKMDLHVLRLALKVAKQAQAFVENFCIAVNISPYCLNAYGAQFAYKIIEIIEASEINFGQVELELIETTKLDEDGFKALRILLDHAIGLAIDDFGRGYSDIQRLIRGNGKQQLFKTLKIDQIFTKGIGSGDMKEIIAATLISLAQKAQMKVIAEGVETEEQLDFLVQHGCCLIEGFLFGTPAPAHELIQKLKTKPQW